jgi:hypothetical protein
MRPRCASTGTVDRHEMLNTDSGADQDRGLASLPEKLG